ncbi:MAG: cupredoxin domain-containing protein [Deinococcaceae bacterium]
MFDHSSIEKFEKIWLLVAAVMVFLLFWAVVMSFLSGALPKIDMAHDHSLRTLDANQLGQSAFAHPGLHEHEGMYEAYIVARAFAFNPPILKVPRGKPITLFFTAADVQHGLQIEDTNINIQLVPGQVAQVEHTFARPGKYIMACNEYCGTGHHNMTFQLIIEDL